MTEFDRQFHTVCKTKTLSLIKGIQGYYGLNKQESFEKMVDEIAKMYNIRTKRI